MEQLTTITTNIHYTKDDAGKEIKWNELVFITTAPHWEYNKKNQLVRTEKAHEHRMMVKNSNIKGVIAMLMEIEKSTEKDLV